MQTCNDKLSLISLLKKLNFNSITYGTGGGGFLSWTIRLLTITLQRLYLAPPNLVTSCFYLSDTFWNSFSKIDSPRGVAAVVFEMRRLEKFNIQFFLFPFKTMERQRGGGIGESTK